MGVRGPQKLGHWTPAPRMGRVPPVETRPLAIYVTLLNLVALGQTIWALTWGSQKNFGGVWLPPLKMGGLSGPLKSRPSPDKC